MMQLSLWLYLSAGLVLGIALTARTLTVDAAMPFATSVVALLLLCGAEVIRHRRKDSLWLADPCVLVTLWIFGIYYGLSNILYLLEDQAAVQFTDFAGMTDLTILACGACFLMWRGYGLRLLGGAGRWVARLLPEPKGNDRLHAGLALYWCAILFLASVVARVVTINLGLYGYAQDEESSTQFLDYLYVLGTISRLGILVLGALSLVAFSSKVIDRRLVWAIAAAVFVEMGFGLISGFKQSAVIPLIVVAGCYYIARKKVPVALLVAAAATLFMAYFLIQPFRTARFMDSAFDSTSTIALAAGLARYATEYADSRESFYSETFEQILGRLNLTGIGAEGLVFAREVGSAAGDPNFMEGFLLFPLLAYVPRIVWPDKPMETVGSWYTQVVLGRPEDYVTSAGMGPLTFLYFAGGVLAVLIGFLLVGVLFRVIRSALLSRHVEYQFLYVAVLPVLVVLEAGNLHAVLVTLLRLLPIFIAVQLLLFVRPKPTASRSGESIAFIPGKT